MQEPLPQDSILQWWKTPRRYIGVHDGVLRSLKFATQLKGSMWDEKFHLVADEKTSIYAVDGDYDYYDYAKDLQELEHSIPEFLFHEDIGNNLMGEVIKELPHKWNMALIYGRRAITELSGLPFIERDSVAQMQEAAEVIKNFPEFRTREFIEKYDAVATDIAIQDRNMMDPYHEKLSWLQREKRIFERMDKLMEAFPRSDSKLLNDIKAIFSNTEDSGSPLNYYRNCIESGNINIDVDINTGMFRIKQGTYNHNPKTQTPANAIGMLARSAERLSAVSMLEDALALVGANVLAAQLTHTYDWKPINEGPNINLKEVVHPKFFLESRSTPNDFVYSEGRNIMAITGLTEGGKTTAVRTLGAALSINQAIGVAPVTYGQAPTYKRFMSLFSSEDDFENDVSSFKGQINAINNVNGIVEDPTFIAADEFLQTNESGVGTEILPGVVEGLVRKGAHGIIATHHHEGISDLEARGIVEARHIRDGVFYELAPGVTPGGYAVRAAIRADLDKNLLGENAERKVEDPARPLEKLYRNDEPFFEGIRDRRVSVNSIRELLLR